PVPPTAVIRTGFTLAGTVEVPLGQLWLLGYTLPPQLLLDQLGSKVTEGRSALACAVSTGDGAISRPRSSTAVEVIVARARCLTCTSLRRSGWIASWRARRPGSSPLDFPNIVRYRN